MMCKQFFLPILLLNLFIFCTNEEEKTTGMITGVVTDSAGLPLDSVLITTLPATTETYSNDTGAYEILDVPPGNYSVQGTKRTYLASSMDITITAGERTNADLVLRQNIRNVVGEMLTTACHCADDGRAEAYALTETLGGGFVYVEYHASNDPTFDTWDPFQTPGSENRRLYYDADTFVLGKWMFFNGTILQTAAGSYRHVVDSLAGIASPIALAVSGSYSVSTGAGTINVQVTAVDSILDNDLVIEYCLCEYGPIDFSPSGPCVVPFRHVLVEMPDHDAITIAYGQTVEASKDFIVPDTIGGMLPPFHAVDRNNIGIVVFVQSENTREVLQAASYSF